MPVSKAQQKAVNKYMAANYDRINLTVPKGKKETIQAHAAAQDESVNGFINRAIDEKMERDGQKRPTEPTDGTGSISHPETHNSRQKPRRGPQGGDIGKGVETMALPAEDKRYTFADVLTWDEKDRIEIINGEAFMMAPPSRVHQKICFEIGRQLGNYLAGKKCEVYPAPFGVRLFEEDGDYPEDVDTMVEPDISVVCDPNKLDDQGCKGAPDLVIEILSPSTRRYDRMTKFNLYQRAGVKELWLVDPDARDVQSFVLEGGRYFVKGYGTAEDQLKVEVLEDCTIDLSTVFPE